MTAFQTFVFIAIGFTGLFILFFTAECKHYSRGHDTWDWVKRIYNRYNLGRIRW